MIFRFVFSSPNRSGLGAIAVSAKSLPAAREKVAKLIESEDRVVSTNVRTGGTWAVIEGVSVSGIDLTVHPMQPDSSIDVSGDANLSFEGQKLKPPIQLVPPISSTVMNDTSTVSSAPGPESDHSQSDQVFVLPVYETPVVVTVLAWFTGFVALGTFIHLATIDYRYLSTEIISVILASAILTNLFFFSVTVGMSYLHKVSFNSHVTNLLLQNKLTSPLFTNSSSKNNNENQDNKG